MEVNDELHVTAALPPGKRATGTHWIENWVGPRTSLDDMKRKILPLPGIEPWPSSPWPVTIPTELAQLQNMDI
jgi:hypothetical protein